MRKVVIVLITALLINLCTVYVSAEGIGDTPKAAEWARTEITKAKFAGIAYKPLLYDYGRDITREEFCTLIVGAYKALGGSFLEIPTQTPFSDTKSWNVSRAYAIGVVSGVSETEFAPYEKITREQMAVMMNRLMTLMEYTPDSGDLTTFEDYDQISSWAADSMSALIGSGIIKGVSDTQLAPLQNVSREQAIVMTWRIYMLLGGKDVLLYEESTPEILTELGIITEEDRNKNTYITTLEALETIKKMKGYSSSVNLSDWYRGDTLSALDYLEDDTKLLLLSLRYSILTYNEIAGLDLESDITNYKALLYVTRLVGDTYGCTDSVTDGNIEKENVYKIAYGKGLISDTDISGADEPITREEFYNILYKALFVEYHRGGVGGVDVYRLIDSLNNRSDTSKPVKENTKTEEIELPISAEIHDDLSVVWTLPEEYSFLTEEKYSTNTALIGRDGTVEMQSLSGWTRSGYDGYELIRYLIRNIDGDWIALRCQYYKIDEQNTKKEYYFDIDISDIKIVIEGDEVNPGTYTRFNRSWTAKEISLAEGENFEEGCYYILKDYDKTYRKEEYNNVSYEVFKAEKAGNTFIAPTNRSFGVNYLDDIHIQKVTIKKDSQTGYVLLVTPESTGIFTIVESPVSN